MLWRIPLALGLFGIGVWCLLYAERVQVRITYYHESLKRTRYASQFFLRVTSVNYEMLLRFFGLILILGFFLLVVDTGMRIERLRTP
ncbi:MAG TPA: hypothetical protein PKJ98_12135 [Verrucomicrobiota bacterium]|nr:hypothetical protein [Verrucomicrobiota bacterium]